MSHKRGTFGRVIVRCLDDAGRPAAFRVPRERRRHLCPDVDLAVSIAVLGVIFGADGLAKIDALATLTAFQRQLLFPPRCRCGADHAKHANNLMRVARGLSPAARALAVAAELTQPDLIALVAEQGHTEEETAQLQLRAVQRIIFGGEEPESSDSIDETEAVEAA